MDVLAGVLPAAASGRDIRGPQQAEDRSRCGHFAMAIDIATVTDPDGFAARMEGLVEQAHDTPLADGVDRIYVPGELEAIAEDRARRDGITVPEKTLSQLRTIAAERQVTLATLGA